jgi:hypothetical protein
MELSKAVAFAALLLVVLLSAGYTLAEGDAGAPAAIATASAASR